MRTIATLTVTASLLAALSGCGNDEPDPAVVKSVSALTTASMRVVSVLSAYKQENSRYPSKMTQKDGKLVVDGVPATSASGARLGWYTTQGSGYAYCIQTATAHQTTSTGGGSKPKVKLDSGPCTTK